MADDEPGVTNETLLIVKIGDSKAGGTDGQLLLEDVEFSKERDNDPKHGIGNDTPQGISHGNITYNVSTSALLNGESADLVRNLDPYTPLSAELRLSDDADADIEVVQTKLDWNSVSIEATDDGDIVLSLDFDARGPTQDMQSSEGSSPQRSS